MHSYVQGISSFANTSGCCFGGVRHYGNKSEGVRRGLFLICFGVDKKDLRIEAAIIINIILIHISVLEECRVALWFGRVLVGLGARLGSHGAIFFYIFFLIYIYMYVYIYTQAFTCIQICKVSALKSMPVCRGDSSERMYVLLFSSSFLCTCQFLACVVYDGALVASAPFCKFLHSCAE